MAKAKSEKKTKTAKAKTVKTKTTTKAARGKSLKQLVKYLGQIPSIHPAMGTGWNDDGNWWVKFQIDISHPLAWHVVQELGRVLNFISVKERLPTVFMPVSPAPYMNGGPDEFLSWLIESTRTDFEPSTCAEWLEGRLPEPVGDEDAWRDEDEDEE